MILFSSSIYSIIYTCRLSYTTPAERSQGPHTLELYNIDKYIYPRKRVGGKASSRDAFPKRRDWQNNLKSRIRVGKQKKKGLIF